MSVYEDSGWYEAAGKLEPELHTGHGLSTELVVTRGEEARKRLEELAAHDLLFGEFHFTLFDPCYSHGDDIVKFAIRHHELMEKHKETNFPGTSQNQTVSSGVEGAHEGTTADKSGPKVCTCPTKLHYLCDSEMNESFCKLTEEEHENLYKPIGICEECHEEIGYWCMHQAWRDESGNQMFRHSINCTAPTENVALAESSLSSPPHDKDAK